MPRFAANLSMMYPEHAFLDRFAAAAARRLRGGRVPVSVRLRRRRRSPRGCDDHGLQQVLFNAPPGDFAAGERGIACLPGREDEFRERLRTRPRRTPPRSRCPRVHVMAGPGARGRRAARRCGATYVEQPRLGGGAGRRAPASTC